MSPRPSDSLSFLDITDELARRAAAKSLAATMSKSHGVKAFPVAVQKLLQAASDRSFRVKDMTEIIESDSSLAVRILRVVNSPAFGLRMRCRKIQTAVTLLGPKRLTEIAVAAAALDWFEDESPVVRGIFAHSTGTATVARALALRAGLAPDELYTCGLLHDFGKLMMLQSGDEQYLAILTESAGRADVCHVREMEVYGFDHALLGAIMLAGWHIPEPVPNVVSWHHQPERAFAKGGTVGKMVAVLRWSERLAHEFEAGVVINDAWLAEMAQDPCAAYLGLAPGEFFAKMCRDLQKKHADSQRASLLEDTPEEDDDAAADEPRGGPSLPPPAPGSALPLDSAAPADSPSAGEKDPSPPAAAADTASPDKVPEEASPPEAEAEPEGPSGPRPILPVVLPVRSKAPPAGAAPPKRPVVEPRRRKVSPASVVAALCLISASVLWLILPQFTRVAAILWALAFVALLVGLARSKGRSLVT